MQPEMARHVIARGVRHRVDEAERLGRLAVLEILLEHIEIGFKIAAARAHIDRGVRGRGFRADAARRADQRELNEAPHAAHLFASVCFESSRTSGSSPATGA